MKTYIASLIAGAALLFASIAIAAVPVTQVVNGGTGSTTLSGILLGNGTASVKTLTIGTGLTLTGGTLSASGAVSSVFGRTGAVTAQVGDYSAFYQPIGTYATFTYPFPSNATTSTLTLGAIKLSNITGSTQCVHADTSGNLTGTGSDCGTGSGGVTGLAATYPLQTTGSTGSITISTAFGTTTSNTFAGTQTFTNLIAGSISGNAGTATALAANGTNCSAGNYPLGVDASGNSEGCTTANLGTLTAVSVATSNGFAGSSSGGTTPALTISTTVTGLLKGNGTAISGAVNGTDFSLITALTCGAGQFFNAVTAAGVHTCGTPAGTTYTGTYPVIVTGSVISSGFGTTTTWGAGNNGIVMTGPTGTPFVQATSSPIAISISGNAATVTTNANLSGVITSSGNVTSYGSQAAGILGNPATGNTAVQATSTLYGAVQNSKVLAGVNGTLQYVATTTDSCSTGVTCSYSGGNNAFSIANSAITNAMLATTYVQSLTVASANGFAGSFTAGATPALTISTSITGLLKGNGTAISAASNGTDFSLITANTCTAGQFFTAATAAGVFTCTASSGGSAFPFTPTTNFGTTVNSTSTPIWLTGATYSIMASSTSLFSDAYFNGVAAVGYAPSDTVNSYAYASTTVYSSSATYIPTPGAKKYTITVIGAGGGGGGGSGTSRTGGTGGNGASTTVTYVGGTIESGGGFGGVGATVGAVGVGGAGAVAIGGDTNVTGATGGSGIGNNNGGIGGTANTRSGAGAGSVSGGASAATGAGGGTDYGAGGGGGDAAAATPFGGGGGGAGGYALKTLTSATVGTSITIAIGGGGGGASGGFGAAAGTSGNNNGGNGGQSSGTAASASNRGGGGGGGGANNGGGGGGGNTGGAGAGSGGAGGTGVNANAGAAASGATGGNGGSNSATSAGTAGGGGGGGGGNGGSSGAASGTSVNVGGGGGAGGIVIVTEYFGSGLVVKNSIGIGTTTPMAMLSILSPVANQLLVAIAGVLNGITYVFEKIDQFGHLNTGGPAPTCGTNCVSVTGDDRSFRVVTGSTVSTATVNFANTYGRTPVCIATEESNGTAGVDASSTPTAVVLNFSTALTSVNIAVMCQISSNFGS